MSTPTPNDPTVKVGGRPYSIRFSQGAFYLLSTWGVDVYRMVDVLNAMLAAGRGKEVAAKIACSALGSYDAAGNYHSLGLPPLDVMDMLLDGEWEALDAAAWEAFKKKLGLAIATTEPPTEPPTEPTSNPSMSGAGSTSGPSAPEPVQPASA